MTEDARQDEISLAALQAGDPAEFARFVDAYGGQVYRLAVRTLADPLDAEDVYQETFLKAYRALPEFEGRSSLSTWLYRIALNEALMLIRKRRPEQVSIEAEEDSEDGPQEPMQIVDWQPLPEAELLNNEGRQALERAVQSLSHNLRVVFHLRDVEGLSIRETADVLDLSETAVKTRLLRARLHLRNQLSEYYRERMAEK